MLGLFDQADRMAAAMLARWLLALVWIKASALQFSQIQIQDGGGYVNVLVAFSPFAGSGSEDECQLIERVKELFRHASPVLYAATHNQTYFKDVAILIPAHWNCPEAQEATCQQAFDKSDVRVEEGPDEPYTVQPLPCGHPGLYVHWTVRYLQESLEKQALSLVREWAHLRFGIFEEYGFPKSELFPHFYYDDKGELVINACTNTQPQGVYLNKLNENYCLYDEYGVPDEECTFKPSNEEEQNVTSSLASLPIFSTAKAFCNATTHNKRAPNKHNFLCDGKSTWEVISNHSDFYITRHVPFSNPNFTVVQSRAPPECNVSGHTIECPIASMVSVIYLQVTTFSEKGMINFTCENSIRNIVIKQLNGTPNTLIKKQMDNKQHDTIVSVSFDFLENILYEISILHRLKDINQSRPISFQVSVPPSTNGSPTFYLHQLDEFDVLSFHFRITSFVSTATFVVACPTDAMIMRVRYDDRTTIRNLMVKGPSSSVFLLPEDSCSQTNCQISQGHQNMTLGLQSLQPGLHKVAILHRLPLDSNTSVSVHLSASSSVLTVNCWVTSLPHQNPKRVIILAHVRRRFAVESNREIGVTAFIDGHNVTLRDKGADPDITCGDGIYSAYVTHPLSSGKHLVYVESKLLENPSCQQTPPFQTGRVCCGMVEVLERRERYPPSRVTDLKGKQPRPQVIELLWTAPGNQLDNERVHFYEVAMATTWFGLFEPNITEFKMADPPSAGEQATYELNVIFSDMWYIKIRAKNDFNLTAPFSNVAQVLSYQP